METPGFGILMMLLSVGIVGLAGTALVYAQLQGRLDLTRTIAAIVVAWVTLYGGVLLGVSLTSDERLLAPGETKKFCGFYLDCHRQVAVVRVDTAASLGTLTATGVFYVVRLRVGSDAKVVDQELVAPELVISDASGRRFDRSAAAEAAVAARGAPAEPLTRPMGAGSSFETTVVFDVASDARDVRLHATVGIELERIVERFLIGDEDSFLHKRTAFRLSA
jgi:hypothetical protein